MILYGVLDLRIRQVIEFFASRAGAETFIAECLADEPDWSDALDVQVIELETSSN
jgi:hypothetical protein